jgi:hypothetical protein
MSNTPVSRALRIVGASALAFTMACLPPADAGRDSVDSAEAGGALPPAQAATPGSTTWKARSRSRVSRLCVGAGASSRFTLQRDADGRETVRGDTEIWPGAGGGGRLRLTETAIFDQHGRLLGADVVATEPPAPETRFALDPRHGTVRVVRGGTAVDWHVPVDAPWSYRPVSSAAGKLVSTPLAALIALRAASANSIVRMLEPESEQSYLATADQVSVPTEIGTTVVLAGDGVDFDDHLVTEVRLLDRRITLRCADAPVEGGA